MVLHHYVIFEPAEPRFLQFDFDVSVHRARVGTNYALNKFFINFFELSSWIGIHY
jgi:hypothetical protein